MWNSPARRRLILITCLFGLLTVASAQTQIPIPNISLNPGGSSKPGDVSSSLQILALLTILSLAPALMMLTTAFTRIVIIMSLTRTAIGAQNIPPNQVIVGLSLFLTFYVMAPTYERVNKDALQPYFKKQITTEKAIERAQKPMREFMLKNTYKSDLKLFVDMRKEVATQENISLTTLIPAFVISELKTAFLVGFYIFIPFIIIDLIVASILMSLGMMMMPPAVVSLPAKLLVFILADGWSVLVKAILSGYM
ncbi:MAG: flagellar type III secretion system pore protein FliP [Armatimonadetes bacterium]|nr:flagellar type III secretion system pore protein FliP [Armatimonadota bacterium]